MEAVINFMGVHPVSSYLIFSFILIVLVVIGGLAATEESGGCLVVFIVGAFALILFLTMLLEYMFAL